MATIAIVEPKFSSFTSVGIFQILIFGVSKLDNVNINLHDCIDYMSYPLDKLNEYYQWLTFMLPGFASARSLNLESETIKVTSYLIFMMIRALAICFLLWPNIQVILDCLNIESEMFTIGMSSDPPILIQYDLSIFSHVVGSLYLFKWRELNLLIDDLHITWLFLLFHR